MPSERRSIDPFDPLSRPDLEAAAPPDITRWIGRADEADPLETTIMPPDGLAHRGRRRNSTVEAFQGKWAAEHLARLPEPGEAFHLITNGRFDTFTLLPAMLELAAPLTCRACYISTWIINRKHTQTLLELYDAGRIQSIGVITGVYFKRRETAVFWQLLTGLRARGQQYRACLNHSKWIALELSDGCGIVLNSSANMAENGNIESHVITNDRPVYEFYRDFARSMLHPAADEPGIGDKPAPRPGKRR